MDVFIEKFEDKFCLVASLSSRNRSTKLEENGAFLIKSGSSHHMMVMRLMFLSVLNTLLDYHVKSRAHKRHSMKGVACVKF
jgi:hypothetical protein